MTALLPGGARRIALSVLTGCVIFVIAVGTVVPKLLGPQLLDTAINSAVQRAVGEDQNALRLVAGLGERAEVGALTLILVGLCLAQRWLTGALLAATAIPVALAMTEYVLKPVFARQNPYGTFPSGHTTATFAMATVVGILLVRPRKRMSGAWRLAIALVGLLAGAAVIVAVIALGMHTLTEALGGAAVGAGSTLSVALVLDLPLIRRLLTRAAPGLSDAARRVGRGASGHSGRAG